MRKRLSAILLAIPLSGAGFMAGFTARTAANAVDASYPEGTTVSGVLLCGESSVIVEKELLTLSIGELPCTEEECGPYSAHVTTQYTLYNPESEDQTLELLFPQAACPEYLSQKEEDCHALTADGMEIETGIRHSYVGYYSRTLDFESSLVQIMESLPVDEFYYKNDLAVHEYVFYIDLRAAALEGNEQKYFSFALTFECNPAYTRVLSENPMTASIENGRIQARFDVMQGMNTVKLTTIGEKIDSLSYGVYTDRFCTNKLEIANPSFSEKTTTFSEYVMRFRPEDTDISEFDWFNGYVQMLVRNTNSTNKCIITCTPDWLRAEAFMRWYSYKLTIPAGGKVVHAVTSPLYPTVRNGRYEYSYLLSSQQKWRSIGSLDIHIETPYHLANSSLEFTKRRGGYSFTRNSLPIGELTFTLIEGEGAAGALTPVEYVTAMSLGLRLALILLGSFGAFAVLSGTAIIIVQTVKRRERLRAEKNKK